MNIFAIKILTKHKGRNSNDDNFDRIDKAINTPSSMLVFNVGDSNHIR